MEINKFFYKVFLVDHQNDEDHKYLGTAFPVAPDGGLLTCRHVVDVEYDPRTHRRGVLDVERQMFCLMGDPVFSANDRLDMAFIPNGLQQAKPEFFPILTPGSLNIGEDVYSAGFFSARRRKRSRYPSLSLGPDR